MALKGLKQPWHSYSESHMNEHMADHSVSSKKFAFTCYDLEMTYLLGHSTTDFQVVCQNRIIKALQKESLLMDRELGKTEAFKNIHDMIEINSYALCYQAQNLIYMYALGLVDSLDEELLDYTRDTTVRNYGREGVKLDGDMPIFRSLIGMKDEIPMEFISEIREEYLEKQGVAKSIREAAKEYGLKLTDTTLKIERMRV